MVPLCPQGTSQVSCGLGLRLTIQLIGLVAFVAFAVAAFVSPCYTQFSFLDPNIRNTDFPRSEPTTLSKTRAAIGSAETNSNE
jgi:hypothetical protein